MTNPAQLEFGFESSAIPRGIFAAPPSGTDLWDAWELEALHRDNRYPITTLEWNEFGADTLGYLRQIEGGVWLWGATWKNKRKHSGGGFLPFRKWGPEYAAMSEAESIEAARDYIAKRLRA